MAIYKNVKLPIIFNGDIKTLADVEKLKFSIRCNDLRALLGNPWLLGELSDAGQQTSINKLDLITEHLNLVVEYYGEKAGIPMFRKHAVWYSNGMKNSAIFRTRVNKTTTIKELLKLLSEFFH